jgi:primosomal protein N' (replication factor Y)
MTTEPGALWRVAVEAPLAGPLTYRAPPMQQGADEGAQDGSAAPWRRGQSVRVPLGRRQVSGLLLQPTSDAGRFKLRDIAGPDPAKPELPEHFVRWIEWLAQYYAHPIGQVAEMTFPPLPRALKARKSRRAPVVAENAAVAPPALTAEQRAVVEAIGAERGFGAHLVHGVTGSGKTEIYMRLMESVVARGQQGIVLVPEISLTPQLIDRFSRRLGSAVAVIHSQLTPREKTNQWWAIVEKNKQVLIGARSALFCPIESLGMIVVDEEHEASFKQDEKLKYQARDAAVMLAKLADCPVVLGSATPSLESWHNASLGRYRLHSLKSRVENRALPEIEVVDMRGERDQRKIAGPRPASKGGDLPFWLSERLFQALGECLERGEQAALFLNRRGIAQSVVCPACGFVPECPNCAVTLTLHGRSDLLCHYCDYHQTLRPTCPECREGEPRPLGMGTELIEKDLTRLFPGARVARMDRDEISTREDLEGAIRAIEEREVDLVVGTQMIAKGLDFPGLTLVGLVLADVAFNLPDFRASERSFQLLTQVAGRSGRHLKGRAGQVVVQTYNPGHPSILFTQAHDYSGFAEQELSFREALGYPPFGRLAAFRVQGPDLNKVVAAARELRLRGQALKAKAEWLTAIEILGPAEAPLARLRNLHRHQLLAKAPNAGLLGAFSRALVDDLSWVPGGVKVAVDIDAAHML